MAGIQGTNIVAPVVPLDTADVHPTHEALYGKGGYRTVATTVERDAIPAARREEGMLVHVAADSTAYRLGADLTTWTVFNTGGGSSAWADITGKPSTFAPSAHTHAIADTTGLQTALDGKAATNAPTFTNLVTFTTDNASTTTINGGSLGTDSVWFADAGPFSRQRYPYTNTERDKLAGIASGATANATDAQLRDRATHTGTQAVSTLATTGTASASTYLRGDGAWTAISTYTLPNATTSTLGGVIVGTGLGVTSGTVSVTYGTTAGTTCQGDDSRLSDARTPTSHVHSASDITTGTIATARLGSGTANSTTFLRGDQTYAAAGSTNAGDLTSGTLAEARLPNLVILHPFLLAGM